MSFYYSIRDKNKRRDSFVLTIDALQFHSVNEQFIRENIDRDITKCFAGFSSTNEYNQDFDTSTISIASGHWGCGAFNGDKQVKCKLI